MNKQTMTVRFWGVRGSYPAPGPGTVQVGGNTPCVEVQVGEYTLILDAGTGIIPLGRELARRAAQSQQPIRALLVFSHMHHDHTQGFPFFAPAFIPSTRLHIYGPHTLQADLEQVLAQNMIPPLFPVTLNDMSASKTIRAVGEQDVIVLDGDAPRLVPANSAEASLPGVLTVRMLRSYAHPGGTLIYRITWRGCSVVYATDTEGYANTDRRLADFARGADLLIHDAQYTEAHYLGLNGGRSTQGWGHSTAAMACDLARAADARRLALFHHDPTYDDALIAQIEREAQARFAGAFAAREGQSLEISRQVEVPRPGRAAVGVALPSGM
ncbi:MAG: MBL fold metallo-hydrolase [Anaerolineales bacterium]